MATENNQPPATETQGTEPQGGTVPPNTETNVDPRDEVKFSQRQLDGYLAAERKKWKAKLSEASDETTTKPDAGGKKHEPETVRDPRIDMMEERFAELDFREWASDRKLNRDQRTVLQKMIDLKDSSTWDSALESHKGIISRLGESPATPAPSHPATDDAPGGSGGNPAERNPWLMTGDDLRRTTREERDKLELEYRRRITGKAGRFFATPPSARGK